jgi:SAM-dependent methyltransferase
MSPAEVWASGAAYEPYVGRWSRVVAREFLPWLGIEPERRWLDVGCGTGMLTRSILDDAAPSEVIGMDPSDGFLGYARQQTTDTRARFELGRADALPFAADEFDAVVAGLVLNFLPDPAQGVREMLRVTRPGGTVAAYVWDYVGKMELMRYCWDAAAALDPAARALDEGRRFAICEPDALAALFESCGLRNVVGRPIEIATHFRDFDDYWSPFLGGQGPAPTYVVALEDKQREALSNHLRGTLPIAADGSIHLVARAWAARGQR